MTNHTQSLQRLFVTFTLIVLSVNAVQADDDKVRIATFNVSLNRRQSGQLVDDLKSPNNRQAQKIAEILQRVRPDIVLLNEFDYDKDGAAAKSFQENYLAKSQGGQTPLRYRWHFSGPVNTGVRSGKDLNANGKTTDPNDCFGFGFYPGQFGMLVLSNFPIQEATVRTFQKFLWKEMPGALLPINPKTKQPYYSNDVLEVFRLSSKSHWDLPLKVGKRTIHLLASHPTPPVFDGKEDRNGRRNHDEIRFWADYISPSKSGYIKDDKGQPAGLAEKDQFVIAGDLNADPVDGDSTDFPIRQLLNHPRVADSKPSSDGASEHARIQGGKNLGHKGNPKYDTADFSDNTAGNLRIDYVLPSNNLKVLGSGVFWPHPNDDAVKLVGASDHRLVWIDVEIE
ncbi:MAG: endonuclease [Planctomycetaceae bacterium]|nr:endonuclease [Planctomycetaceae bacterium]